MERDQRELHPDQRVDQYRIRHRLGQGGMGAVYLARDTVLGRRVALKVILPHRLGAEGSADQFLEEARVTAQFSHPHIVQVYGMGEWEGRPYLALEYVDGASLRQQLVDGRLPTRRALRIGMEIALALAEAHRQGVLHRDLKPDNVLLATDGRTRVVDFGLARQLQGEIGHGTTTGLAGTPAYLAPEQWRTGATTTASDVWSLGVCLHEMLTGAHPFLGGTVLISRELDELRTAITRPDAEAPRLPGDEYPDEVADLVARCLARAPEDRPSAAAIAAQLDRTLRGADRPGDTEDCPYRGLQAFSESESGVFFGREAEIALFVERMRTEPTLAVVGPSGAGKSSFGFAGVVPRLRERGHLVVLSMRPGRDPIGTLASRLASSDSATMTSGTGRAQATLDWDALPEEDDAESVQADPLPARSGSDIADLLRRTPTVLPELLARIATARKAQVLLVVDQLEEVETLCDDPAERDAFMAALGAAADDPDEPIRLVLTVRDDFLGRLVGSPAAARTLSHVAVLRPMDRENLREALVRPLEVRGYQFDDPRLVGHMLDEVAGEHTPLPTLQFAARALWERRDRAERVLRRGDYEAIGGVGGALARHADEVLAAMQQAQRDLARGILLRLVTADGTRKVLPWTELVDGLPAGAGDVLERLVQSRLLALRDGEAREVELAHESLIQTWARLRRWTSEASEEVRALEELEEAARLWERRGRRADDVWTDESLDAIQTLATTGELPVSGRAQQFVEAGVVERQRAALRTRRLVILGFAVLAGVTVISVAAAFQFAAQRQVAIHNAERATTARADALISDGRAALASGDPLEARAKLRSGLELRDSTAARGLWWDLQHEDVVWAHEGGLPVYNIAVSPDGRRAAAAFGEGIVRVYDLRTGRFQTNRTEPVDLADLAFSPDGSGVAAVGFLGKLRIWREGEPEARVLPSVDSGESPFALWWPEPNTVYELTIGYSEPLAHMVRWDLETGEFDVFDVGEGGPAVLTADGHTWVKVPYRKPGIEVWNLGDSEPTRVFGEEQRDPRARSLAVEPGGSGLLIGGGTLQVWDMESGELRHQIEHGRRPPGRVAWTESGQLVAVDRSSDVDIYSADDGTRTRRIEREASTYLQGAVWSSLGWLATAELYGVRILDVQREQIDRIDRGHRGQIEGLDVAEDGRVASGASDGKVIQWTEEGVPTVIGSDPDRPVQILRYSEDGTRIAAGTSGGRASVFRASDGHRMATLSHVNDVMGVDFSPDGDSLWAVDWSGWITRWDLSGLDADEASEERPATVAERFLHPTSLRDIAAFPGGIAYVSELGELILGREERVIRAHAADTHTVDYGGGRLASVSFDNQVQVRTVDGELLLERAGNGSTRVSLSRDGRQLAYATSGGVAVVDVDTGEERLMWADRPGNALALHPTEPILYGADRAGVIRSWDTNTGAPRWRGVALSTEPLATLNHTGWRDPAGEPIEGPPVPEHAVQHAIRGTTRCTLRADRTLLVDVAGRTSSHPTDQPVRVDAAADGCLLLDAGGLSLVRGAGTEVLSAHARWARPGPEGLTVLADRIAVRRGGVEISSIPTPEEATAATPIGSALYVGFRDGSVERWVDGVHDPGLVFGSASQAHVVDLIEGPDGTVFVALANGEIAMWDPATGGLVLSVKLHGPVIRWARTASGLLALTEVGDAAWIDLSVFGASRCTVLGQVVQAVPVRWSGEAIEVAADAVACP